MKILSLDSSSRYISAALAVDGAVRSEFNVSYDRSASEKLAHMAKEILDIFSLKIDDIDAFAVSKGPGSFTGLRIAAAMIKAFSFKDNKKIYTVSSLKAMSYRYKGMKYILPAIDARRDRAFAALYTYMDNFDLLKEERIYTIDEIIEIVNSIDEKIIMPGDFYKKYKDNFSKNIIEGIYRENEPIAKEILDYVIDHIDQMQADDRYGAIPTYMKSSQAEEDKK